MRRQLKVMLLGTTLGICALAATGTSVLSAQAPIPVYPGQAPQVYPQPAPVPVYPQQAPVSPQVSDTGEPIPLMAPNQLDNLVAPIALYPDPLMSQVLVAATYPLEVVQAAQWLQRNPGLTGPALTQAAEQQNWDPSVQALVMFPEVLRRLSDDVTWTTALGNAFLAQQQDVMNAVQRLRVQAQQGGHLVSTPQQQVVTTVQSGQPVVVIEPTYPDVIYVPYYDPTWFWGPAYFYPYPRWHYPVRTAGAFFYWGPAIQVGFFLGGGWGGWGGWGWHPSWGGRTIIVNNTFVHRYNFNTTRIGSVSGTSVWTHDAYHRQGVPYPAAALTQRYRPGVQDNLRSRQALAPQARVAPTGPRAPAAAARSATPSSPLARSAPTPARAGVPSTRALAPNAPAARAAAPPAASYRPPERMGNRQVSPDAGNRSRSAFGGIENGQTARAHTDHGYSSLGPSRSSAAPGRPSGGSQAPASRSNSGGGGGKKR